MFVVYCVFFMCYFFIFSKMLSEMICVVSFAAFEEFGFRMSLCQRHCKQDGNLQESLEFLFVAKR